MPVTELRLRSETHPIIRAGISTDNPPDAQSTAPRPDPLLREALALSTQPGFPQAVREFARGMVRFREAPRLVNKLTSHESRLRVIGYLLYLHADRERFGPEGGATYVRLLELCTRDQEVSPRVLKTTLALLRLTGFIHSQRNAADLRSAYYRPTQRMLEQMRLWLSGIARSLDRLQPQPRYLQRLDEDPAVFDRFMVASGRARIAGVRPVDFMPEFVGFFGRRAGAGAVAIGIMHAHLEGAPFPSRAQIARRFGLAKSQVSSIIGDGTQLGYFEVDAAGMAVPTSRLCRDFSCWVSLVLAFCARHLQPA